ncbi:MAG TPA: ABC transporter permease, partial [Cyclobacteriaceae bacterium]|nr:ABC transporter permease [Cyclobacteriaceae bacterium]
SSVAQVVVMLSGGFTRLVAVSFILAAPLAYFGMGHWLQTFAYRVEVTPLTVMSGGGAALVLSWLTISYQSFKAARANPAKSLRSE